MPLRPSPTTEFQILLVLVLAPRVLEAVQGDCPADATRVVHARQVRVDIRSAATLHPRARGRIRLAEALAKQLRRGRGRGRERGPGGAPLAANNLLTLITVAACQGRRSVHRVIARLAWRRARVWVLALFASDDLRAHRISAACQRRLSIDGVIACLARGCARVRPVAHLASDNLLALQLSAA